MKIALPVQTGNFASEFYADYILCSIYRLPGIRHFQTGMGVSFFYDTGDQTRKKWAHAAKGVVCTIFSEFEASNKNRDEAMRKQGGNRGFCSMTEAKSAKSCVGIINAW